MHEGGAAPVLRTPPEFSGQKNAGPYWLGQERGWAKSRAGQARALGLMRNA
jgi:hypothetical protein